MGGGRKREEEDGRKGREGRQVVSGRGMGRRERMHTIDEAEMQHKEKMLKESIEVMQGVLTEIQNQKSQRRVLKVKRASGVDK